MPTASGILIEPTSIAYTGTSATIGANGSVTFTACSSLSLNGVVSTDYDNYTVVLRSTPTSSDNYYIRFRVSGADNSTASSYVNQFLDANSTSVGAGRTTNDYGRFHYTDSATVAVAGAMGFIYGPHLTQPTAWRTVGPSGYAGAYLWDIAGTHNQSISYDGFTLYRAGASSTISGRVAVYGMRQ